jgi:hypothetical protein
MMAAINPHAFDNKENILRSTIAMHFIRQGNFEIGDTFAKVRIIVSTFCVLVLFAVRRWLAFLHVLETNQTLRYHDRL